MSEAPLIGAGPRAPFMCEKCLAAGKMTEPVELPVSAKRCPFCGKAKWLSRVWSGYSPMISTGGDMQKFREADHRVEAAMLAHDAVKDSRLRAEKEAIKAESVVPGINMRVRAISTQPQTMSRELGGFGAAMGGVSGGKAAPTPMQAPAGHEMTAGAQKIMSFGKRNSILDPNPQQTREAVGL